MRGNDMASVRYIVEDIDGAVDFYRKRLGFGVEKHSPGKFAALKHDDLDLFLNAPGAGSAGKAGGNPEPGGWNRFMIVTKDLDGMIDGLRKAGASFRGEVSEAGAGRQILLQDPSGNVVELFEYAQRTA
jgi:catechol 2,3-dioxygenase-like lactoylglutathione lyase family enzyme